MKRYLLAAVALTAFAAANASQPLRRYVTLTTLNGEEVTVTRMGDSNHSWWATADDQRYQRQSATGLLVPDATTLVSAYDSGANMRRHAMSASTEDGLGRYNLSGNGVVGSLGRPKIPVIMAAYSDLDFLNENTTEKITRFLNEEGYHDEKYAVGSVGDYFEHCSYGAFRPQFDVVAKVTLPHDHKYYGAHYGSSIDSRRSEMVRDAISLAEAQGADFSVYATNGHTPLVSVLFAGPGEQEDYGNDYEDYIWAHYSQTSFKGATATIDSYLLSNETMRDVDQSGNVTREYMTGIGTFCHEFGHALGLPDMYDVNGSTNGAGHTPGYWDIMDYQFMYDGFRPMEYSAYERSMMGWLDVADLDDSRLSQTHTLTALGGPNRVGTQAFRIVSAGNQREYFILENRQLNSFYQDNYLGTGMLIWHIDYESGRWGSNIVNTIADQQRVAVIPADGAWQQNQDVNKRDSQNNRYTFTGDLFPGYANVTAFNSEIANFRSAAFDKRLNNISESDGVVTFVYSDPKTVGVTPLPYFGESHGAVPTILYDLSGRRLDTAPTKGLYIRDGKVVGRGR